MTKKKAMILLLVIGFVLIVFYLYGFFSLVSVVFYLADIVSVDLHRDLFAAFVASFLWGMLCTSVRNLVADVIQRVKCYKKSLAAPEVTKDV